MFTLQQFTSIFLRFGRVRVRRHDPAVPKPRAAEVSALVVSAEDDEQVFLASIASLPPEQREHKLALRAWYRQLAERQGIIEVESHVQRNLWK